MQRVRQLIERVRERLILFLLPKDATVSFAPPLDTLFDDVFEEWPPEVLLFGGTTPNPPVVFVSFGNQNDCPAGTKARMESAKETAQANYEQYGDITDRRDVFFAEVERKGQTAIFPISTVQ